MHNVKKITRNSFFTNLFLAIIKIICGLIGRSSALIADGIHSFSDLLTDIIAILGNFFSLKPADEKHPYGHGKLEYLTSIAIGIMVMLIGLILIGSSANREISIPSLLVILVSCFTIIAKLILSRYLIKKGELYNNSILIASGKESSADVISSIVVLISGILMQLVSVSEILKYADKIASIIVGIFIVHTGYSILKENISGIIGEQETSNECIENLRKLILNNQEIKKIDSMVLLKFGSYYKVIIEISMDGNISLKKSHDIVDKLEKIIKINEEKAKYITIHVNPI